MRRAFGAGVVGRLAAVASVVVLWAIPVFAQSTGRVEGIIKDATGASVPGASVTATNQGTNAARTVITDASGSYVLTPLAVGNYKIKVELLGFKEQTAKLSLTVNQVARMDFTVEVGGQTEVVEVTGAAPLIDKSTSFIGTVIDNQQVEDLPLNGRNFTQLATLAPGVNRGVPGSNAAGQSGEAETFRYGEVGGGAISANGLREQFNNFMIDGIDNNETLVNSIAYFPSPEAIQEFRDITTNAPAEFGRAGGAIFNLVTKSGSNTFHGSAYEFNRAKGLAAKPKFAAEKPDFSQNDFGATLGGPIVKDKTFFFASYHGLKSTIPVEAGNRVTVPTARMRNGDFSELLDPGFSPTGAPIVIADPATGVPYPGNVIPPSQLDPVGVAYLNLYPLPDGPGAVHNYLTHREKKSTFNDFDGRLDHIFSQSDSLFLRGSFWNDKFSDPGRIPCCQAGFGSGTSDNKGYQLGLGETHTFSSNVVNEFHAGYINFHFEFLPVGFGNDQDGQVGIPGPGGIHVANGISLIGGGNGTYIEYLGDFGQYIVRQKTFQISDAVTWIRGSHNFKLGGTLMQRDLEFERTQFGKGFYFFSDQTSPSAGHTGYEVADMLVAKTAFTATGVPGYVPRETKSWENSLFIQDDWRVDRKLTLNLGLRYDLFTPYYEVSDKLANYDPARQSLVLPNQNGVPRSTVNTDKNNFGPRVGFAYQVNDKTVVHGSYGIFYSLDRGGVDHQLSENPPAVVTEFRFDGPGANVRLSQPIALPTPVDPTNPVLPLGSGVVFVPRDSKTSLVHQFSGSVQRELSKDTAVMVAYVGTRGRNLTAVTSAAGFGGGIEGRITSVQNIGTSKYDSLQVTLRRNLSSGFSYLASYTLGKATNDTPGQFPGNASAFSNTPTQICVDTAKCNLSLDAGAADYDARHRFTFAATYELPFAKDDKILGGWSVNTIVTLQSGTPFSVFANGKRADQNGDPNNGPKKTDQWFNTSVFTPAAGPQGTEPRNSVRGPGIQTVDLSLFKTFKFGGGTGLELRIEGFNIFNHPQYGFPNQFLGDPNFGKITSTRLNSERQFQLAARFTF